MTVKERIAELRAWLMGDGCYGFANMLAHLDALEKELEGEREFAESQRVLKEQNIQRWTAAQESLALIERRLVSLTGLAQSIEDNLSVCDALRVQAEALAGAWEPFKRFAEAFDAKPINGLDSEEIYSIHGGDYNAPEGASLKWSDIRKGCEALAAYRSGKSTDSRGSAEDTLLTLQKAIPPPERIREIASEIWVLCEDCDDSAGPEACCRHGAMFDELSALAYALEGKSATAP